MTNYIVMWQRDGDEGFDFIDAENHDAAIEAWLKRESGWHIHGCLTKMIIVETNHSMKVPLDTYGYYYGCFDEST